MTPDCRLEPVLVAGRKFDASVISHFPPHELVRVPIFDRGSPSWLARAIGRRTVGRDPLFERVLSRHDVRVVSHLYQPWRSGRIGVIGWIPDLQHFRLPQYFGPTALKQRDRRYRQICEQSMLVIVSSEASRLDLAEFAPDHAHKARVLRFAVEPPDAEAMTSPEELSSRYGLDGPYFHLPNQFWGHKNHAVVIEALARLRERGGRATVISTGKTAGTPGQPDVFADVVRRATELGVDGDFRALGVIPHEDLTGLMRGATAVINPSFFEGWSTPVEEAKCLGKRVLLSDIAVHREQAPARGVFFDPNDPEELANCIEAMLREADELPIGGPFNEASTDLQGQFARRFEAIVVEAMDRIKPLG